MLMSHLIACNKVLFFFAFPILIILITIYKFQKKKSYEITSKYLLVKKVHVIGILMIGCSFMIMRNIGGGDLFICGF